MSSGRVCVRRVGGGRGPEASRRAGDDTLGTLSSEPHAQERDGRVDGQRAERGAGGLRPVGHEARPTRRVEARHPPGRPGTRGYHHRAGAWEGLLLPGDRQGGRRTGGGLERRGLVRHADSGRKGLHFRGHSGHSPVEARTRAGPAPARRTTPLPAPGRRL